MTKIHFADKSKYLLVVSCGATLFLGAENLDEVHML